MSLDVYLTLPNTKSKRGSGIFVRENGSIKEINAEEWNEKFPGREPIVVEDGDYNDVYSANITHNLGSMADEAGIYKCMWRPEELDITHAYQLIPLLEEGLEKLKQDPEKFQEFNPSNGWGSYEGLVKFTVNYLDACKSYPNAKVEAWR